MIINFLALRYQLEKKEIIQLKSHIKNAKYSIWLKNVWFTHKGISNLLVQQIQKGLSVHIILTKDFVDENKEYLDFNQLANWGAEFFILPEKLSVALKPTQFMLIDNRIIIQNATDSQFQAETKDLIKEGWASMLIRAYTEWFIYLETRADNNIYRR